MRGPGRGDEEKGGRMRRRCVKNKGGVMRK